MNKEVNLQLLESYLAGDIGADEVLDMEGNALTKEELLLAVEDYQDVLIHMEGAALKEELVQIQASITEKPLVKGRKIWFGIAAVIIFFITATFLWQSINSEPEFEDYYSHFPQLETFRDSDAAPYASGMEAYMKLNYEEAFSKLSVLADLPDDIRFYQGVSAVGSRKFAEAIQIFGQLGTTPSNKYYQQTKWYLGLAYWQQNQVEQARNVLGAIKSGDYEFERSRELLEKLPD